MTKHHRVIVEPAQRKQEIIKSITMIYCSCGRWLMERHGIHYTSNIEEMF